MFERFPNRTTLGVLTTLVMMLAALASCTDASETPRVQLSIRLDSSGLEEAVTTDLGWEVETTTTRVVLEDIQFTIAGEVHTSSLLQKTSDFFITPAHAHPGHYQGGEVTGVLEGAYLADWSNTSEPIGEATLLVGRYEAVNFTLGRGDTATNEALTSDDPLVGQTALIEGIARKDGQEIAFSFVLGAPTGRQIIGIPFKAEVGEDANGKRLGLRFLPYDKLEEDTLYDALDFAALDGDGDGKISISESSEDDADQDAYNTLRRTFQTHDHFEVVVID